MDKPREGKQQRGHCQHVDDIQALIVTHLSVSTRQAVGLMHSATCSVQQWPTLRHYSSLNAKK